LHICMNAKVCYNLDQIIGWAVLYSRSLASKHTNSRWHTHTYRLSLVKVCEESRVSYVSVFMIFIIGFSNVLSSVTKSVSRNWKLYSPSLPLSVKGNQFSNNSIRVFLTFFVTCIGTVADLGFVRKIEILKREQKNIRQISESGLSTKIYNL
jgi:uncharacterized membrane protein